MELLFSTGLRVSELCSLSVGTFLLGESELRLLVNGKGRKNGGRVVCECYMLGKCWTGAYCRYFREAVLPLNPALEAALNTEGPAPETRPCPICGQPIPIDGRRRYCSEACSKAARQKKQRGYMRKYRG